MTTAKILVVDDEPQIRRVIRAALTSEGYIITDAKSGEAALEKIREVRFDLVLLDFNMPGMSGLEACYQIRESSEVGIIMLTVRDKEADKIAALDAGADDFVTKPFSMPELLARIRANLRRVPLSPDGGSSIIRFGDIEINLASRNVSVRGQHVAFTPKEFDLLHYLAENPNVAIPHGKLLQTVWGPDYGDQVEYLHVFINKIRKKIERDPGKPHFLLTEARIGYRFRTDSLENI